MKYTIVCENCHHIKVAYTYQLNVGRVQSLYKLVQAHEQFNRPMGIKELNLTNAQYVTFCHLQYWGLVQNIGGAYIPTPKGIDFIYGEIPVYEHVAVIESEPLPYSHEAWKSHTKPLKQVYVYDIDQIYYKQRKEYQMEKSLQLSLI